MLTGPAYRPAAHSLRQHVGQTESADPLNNFRLSIGDEHVSDGDIAAKRGGGQPGDVTNDAGACGVGAV